MSKSRAAYHPLIWSFIKQKLLFFPFFLLLSNTCSSAEPYDKKNPNVAYSNFANISHAILIRMRGRRFLSSCGHWRKEREKKTRFYSSAQCQRTQTEKEKKPGAARRLHGEGKKHIRGELLFYAVKWIGKKAKRGNNIQKYQPFSLAWKNMFAMLFFIFLSIKSNWRWLR